MVGKRQRHRHLAVRLLAELPAILVRHSNRMPPLLGKARVVDDPRLDRAVMLDPGQHHLSHLAQHVVVGPFRLTNKMQQRLMLRRRSPRRRDRRHRLYALALTRHHQSHAIVAQRTRSIRVADHSHKPTDIRRKPYFSPLFALPIHASTSRANPKSCFKWFILKVEACDLDSVRLAKSTPRHCRNVSPILWG